jgi:Flp pilus assembly protein TadB
MSNRLVKFLGLFIVIGLWFATGYAADGNDKSFTTSTLGSDVEVQKIGNFEALVPPNPAETTSVAPNPPVTNPQRNPQTRRLNRLAHKLETRSGIQSVSQPQMSLLTLITIILLVLALLLLLGYFAKAFVALLVVALVVVLVLILLALLGVINIG